MTLYDRSRTICTFQEKRLPAVAVSSVSANISIRLDLLRRIGTIKVKDALFDSTLFRQMCPSISKQI